MPLAGISEENSAAVEQISASTQEMNSQVDFVNQSARDLKMNSVTMQQIVEKFILRSS